MLWQYCSENLRGFGLTDIFAFPEGRELVFSKAWRLQTRVCSHEYGTMYGTLFPISLNILNQNNLCREGPQGQDMFQMYDFLAF